MGKRMPLDPNALTRRELLQAGAAAGLALAGCASSGGMGAGASRPNVLFIMADDRGTECVGAYGGNSYATPQLDRMARAGLRFTHCYCTPLCTPSRVQVMTGQYPFRSGYVHQLMRLPRDQQLLDPGLTNFAHVLRDAG